MVQIGRPHARRKAGSTQCNLSCSKTLFRTSQCLGAPSGLRGGGSVSELCVESRFVNIECWCRAIAGDKAGVL